MKTVICVLVCALMATASVSAQARTPTRAQNGRAKIWIGAALLGSGALLIPLTAPAGHQPRNGPSLEAGLGLMSAGGVMLWWGFNERRRAARPQAVLGVSLGRTSGVQVRCLW